MNNMEQDFSKSKVQENNVQFKSWNELLKALEHEYTTSFRDVCKMLKVSRVWVNKYIRPFVKSTYIRSNKRGDTTAGIDWVRLASIQLNRKNMTESIWFHTKELEDYFKKSIVSITKQTKKVPYTYFMDNAQIEAYLKNCKSFKEIINNPNASTISKGAAINALEVCHYNFLKDDLETTDILKYTRKITERTKTFRTPILIEELPSDFLYKMDAIHDLKDYGDADETIYRNLFKQGAIRIEMNFTDNDGVIGKKVYYVPDPVPVKNEHQVGSFTIDEAAWRKYTKS